MRTRGQTGSMELNFAAFLMFFFFYRTLAGNTDVMPYCEGSTFSANCDNDSVVVMKSAQYGRMRTGPCVERSYGNIGCYTDVTTQLDALCSGRTSCEVRVSAIMDAVTSSGHTPCSRDLRSYLEAGYTCQPVITTEADKCNERTHLYSNATSGFLSNAAHFYSNADPRKCPWILKAPVGHRFNLTLHNFQRPTSQQPENVMEVCHIVATITEPRLGTQHSICAGARQVTHAYTSRSEVIHVEILRRPMEGHILIQFNVTGCGDPEAPSNGWYERVDDVTAVLRCHGSVHSAKAVCANGTWAGKNLYCPLVKQYRTMDNDDEITIALIITVAAVVGAMILLVGLLYIRKRARKMAENNEQATSSPKQDHAAIYSTAMSSESEIKAKDIYEQTTPGGIQANNDYFRTWGPNSRDRPFAGSTSAHADDTHSHGSHVYHVHSVPRNGADFTTKYKFRHVDHIYESPPFDRKYVAYHELEPYKTARNNTVDNLL